MAIHLGAASMSSPTRSGIQENTKSLYPPNIRKATQRPPFFKHRFQFLIRSRTIRTGVTRVTRTISAIGVSGTSDDNPCSMITATCPQVYRTVRSSPTGITPASLFSIDTPCPMSTTRIIFVFGTITTTPTGITNASIVLP